MDVQSTKQILKEMPRDKSVMLHAKHGVGKSSVVRQVAEELAAETGESHGFWDVRLSQCEVGDIKGLPDADREAQVIRFLKQEWWPRDKDSKGILFFDEINRASKDVLQAVFEICLDRRLDGEDLPDGWRVVAAVNSDDDYDVQELDPALHDRWFHIDFDPSVKDWTSWARENSVEPAVIEFVSRNHNLLDPPVGNLEAGRTYPSRRSWERLSKTLKNMGGQVESSTTLYHLTCSFIGFEGAVAFNDFMKNYERQVTVEDILDHGKLELTEDWKINDHNSMIEKFKAKGSFDDKLEDNQLQNLANYFVSLPSEIAMTLWQAMGQTDSATYNVAKLHSISASCGKKVQDFIVEILTAK